MNDSLDIVFLGLSITSSWGNGHATTYRGLVRELDARGHHVLFLERDAPWYAQHRDLPNPPWGRTELYVSLDDVQQRFAADVRAADLVIVGSFVPDGIQVGRWVVETARGVKAFYDIDTPVTLAALDAGRPEYVDRPLIQAYDAYLSFTGGPTLERLRAAYGASRAYALYCSIDPALHYPEAVEARWDLGYLGTYSADRQPAVETLMLQPARRWPDGRFVVAGPQYPDAIRWPANVRRIEHVPPAGHRAFYCAQRFTLSVTRRDMVRAGYAPSVRLFEAAACGVPIVSDWWEGLDEFFEPGKEILIAHTAEEVLAILHELPEETARRIARAARTRVLASHTAAHRAAYLEQLTQTLASPPA